MEAELREEAKEVLSRAGEGTNKAALEALMPDTQLPLIHARLTNHAKITKLSSLKSSHYGKYQCFVTPPWSYFLLQGQGSTELA